MKDAASQARVDKWLAAFIAQDADGIMSLFSKDGYLEDLPLRTTAYVNKDLKEFLDFNFKAFPNWTFAINNWDASETSGVIEWTMKCAKMGAIPGMSAEGKPVELRGVTVHAIENGKIKSQTDYWDMASVLRQTGDLPSE